MSKLILFLLLMVASTNAYSFNELDKELSSFYTKNQIKIDTRKVDDYTFIRRIYLDIAGRIPKTEEIKQYIQDKSLDKKHKLIEKLIYSEDYTNNFYNFFADLFRIRPERISDNIQMRSYPYMEYIRDSVRSDKPYDIWIKEMLTATGRLTDNGAAGYILRDDGMAFDNITLTTQIFLANAQNCNNCHDDPFSDKTMKQFYEFAAFFNNENRENRKDYKDILKKVDDDIKVITKTERIDNSVRQLISSNLVNIHDNPTKTIKYPFDYKYDNAKPGETVIPVSLDGKIQAPKEQPRQVIADWITKQDGFAVSITNRIWMNIVGYNMAYPQPLTDIDVNHIKQKEILVFLSKYLKQNNFSLKSLIRLIIESDFYTNQAYNGSYENYMYQGIFVKRLSSHQLWDSIISLILDDPNYTRISFDEYSNLFNIDWTKINGQYMLDKNNSIREWDAKLTNGFLKYKNIELVRSCFNLRSNNFVALFLKEFGASDRLLLDTSSNQGTITQLLTLMNSPIIDVIVDKKSSLMKYNRDQIFASIMTRPVGVLERPIVEKLEISDMVWVLLNSNEFLFRK